MATKAELLKRCEELGIPTENLSNNEEREAAIQAKEAELANADQPESPDPVQGQSEDQKQKDQEQEDQGEEDQEEEDNSEPGALKTVYTDKRGRDWRFKENAPKTIRIDGHPMTQQEILDTEDVIAELVYGNNSFLTQID